MDRQARKEIRYVINTRMFLLFMGILMVMNGLMSTSRYGRTWLAIAKQVSEAEESGTLLPEEQLTESAVEETEAAGATAGSGEKTTEASAKVSDAGETITEASTQAADPEDPAQPDVNELARQMRQLGITVRDLRVMGIIYMVVAVIEMLSGLICIIFSNRVKRAKIVFAAVIVLLAGEAVFIVETTRMGMLMLSTLLYSVLIPCILLRQALKLLKFAKEDPDRIYVIEPAGAGRKTGREGSARKKDPQPPVSGGEKAANAPQDPPSGKSLHDRAMMQAEEDLPEDAEEDPLQTPSEDAPEETE